MQGTLRLFDADSHCFDFTATVLSCTPLGQDGLFDIVLDRTAFFPEGGGQAADPGMLDGIAVTDVQSRVDTDGTVIIHHTVSAALSVGSSVTGQIHRETRLARMQCHTAEHILSGLIHRHHGLDNVGFHLGSEDVTLDFNGTLTRAQLDAIEDEANRIVRACLPVRADYPSPEVLAATAYRAKLALTENVRLVTIGEGDQVVDRCACCAPHVANTGEIGIIKMLDFARYKGGIRIHMLAGMPALADYRARYTAVAAIASDLSVKQENVMSGYARLKTEAESRRATVTTLRKELQDLKVAALPSAEGNLCLFCDGLEIPDMRQLLSRAVDKCGRLCGIFSGSDDTGYVFVIGRGRLAPDLKRHAPLIMTAIDGRGGGTSDVLQGRATATRETIQAFFASFEVTATS